jgi:hypothetical protein
MIAKDLVPEMGARSFAIMKARRQREAGGGSGGWCYCLGEADSRFPIQDLSVSRGIRSTITGLTPADRLSGHASPRGGRDGSS